MTSQVRSNRFTFEENFHKETEWKPTSYWNQSRKVVDITKKTNSDEICITEETHKNSLLDRFLNTISFGHYQSTPTKSTHSFNVNQKDSEENLRINFANIIEGYPSKEDLKGEFDRFITPIFKENRLPSRYNKVLGFQKSVPPFLTSADIVELYHEGLRKSATHMIWYIDQFCHSDFLHLVYPNRTIEGVLDEMKADQHLEIVGVFALHLDIYQQINEKRPYHIETQPAH